MPIPTASRSSASSETRLTARNARLRSGVGVSRYGRLRRMSANGASGGRSSAGERGASFVATDRFMLLAHQSGKVRLGLGGQLIEANRAAAACDHRQRCEQATESPAVDEIRV